jgi:spermidine synthase
VPHEVWVYEESHYRYLSFIVPGKETQTCIDLNNPSRVVYDYQKIILASLFTIKKPSKICIIGLGGGSLALACHKLFPETAIENIEFNPIIVECAKKYFNFEENQHIKIFLQDGVKYLKELPKDSLYDVIIIDAFDEFYIPKAFLTVDFVKDLYEHLSPNGIALINTFKKASSYEQETKLYQHVFGSMYNLEYSYSFEGNRVIFVRKGEIEGMNNFKNNIYQHVEEINSLNLNIYKLISCISVLYSK